MGVGIDLVERALVQGGEEVLRGVIQIPGPTRSFDEVNADSEPRRGTIRLTFAVSQMTTRCEV